MAGRFGSPLAGIGNLVDRLQELVRAFDKTNGHSHDGTQDQGPILSGANYVYNVKAYGAKGDGTTNDTAAIQAAIDAANGVANGAAVFLPPGTYLISSTLDLGTKAILFEGAGGPGLSRTLGWGASQILLDGAIVGLQWGTSNATGNFTGPVIRNLQIIGDSDDTSAGGIHLLAPATFRLENVAVGNCPAGYGIYLDASGQSTDLTGYGEILECSILFCLIGIDGVHMNGVRVVGGWISPEGNNTTATPDVGSYGVRIQSGDGWSLFGTRIQYAATGIDLQGSTTGQHTVMGTRTEGCNTHIRVACDRNLVIPGSMAGGAVGAGDVGVSLVSGADRNVVLLGGVSGITTPLSDAGSGNVSWNTQEPTGTAATGMPHFSDHFLEGIERTDPAAPATNAGRIYLKDNGAGKTQLVVRFNTGAVQVLATEP